MLVLFYSLVVITVGLSVVVSMVVADLARAPIATLLGRFMDETMAQAWARYTYVALVLAGVVGGVPMYELERMVGLGSARRLGLSREQWVLTIVESALGAVEAIASTLMTLLFLGLVAYTLIRRAEARRPACVPDAVSADDGFHPAHEAGSGDLPDPGLRPP